MKFGKITSAKAAENALVLGGALGGGALSGGLMTLVPQEQKIYARGGVTVLSVLGAASMKPKTSAETLVQALLIGMGIRQASEAIRDLTKDKIQVTAESSTTDKFVAGMAGLACPCEESTTMLAAPVIDFPKLPENDYAQKQDFSQEPEVIAEHAGMF